MIKVLAFLRKLLYTKRVASAKEKWSIGQAVKTSPSHGENRGSIPLSTAEKPLSFKGFFVSIDKNRFVKGQEVCYTKKRKSEHLYDWGTV